MKKLGNILFYTLNTFFIGGLLAFAIIFWMMGDRFHAIIDALYLLIIVEMFYLRRKCKLLQKDNESLLEGSKVLVEQNAKMALSIANRAYVLETGNVVLTGTGKELIESPEIQKAYLGG